MTQIDGRLLVGLLVALLAMPGCHDDSTQVTPGIAPDADASGGEDVGPDVADGETDSGVDVDDDTSGCLTAEDCPQPDDACGLAMCGADGSCSMAPRPDGEFCDDGDTCTAGETCQSGACSGGVDVCADCAESPDGAPCDDGDACTQGETCLSGACAGGDTVTCSASAPCQSALCDPVEGCVEVASDDGQVCSDGNACTSGDQCVSGVCEGGDNTCDCSSDDDCAPFAGPCAAALTCASGQCVVSDEPETCPQPADPCLQAVCDAVAGGCVAVAVADGTPCESGVPGS